MRASRNEQPPQHLAPLGAVRAVAGVSKRGPGFALDRGRHAAGLLQLVDADDGLACVLAHQPLQHESKERQRVRLARNFGLQSKAVGTPISEMLVIPKWAWSERS